MWLRQPFIFVAIVGLLVCGVGGMVHSADMPLGMDLVAQNDALSLFFDGNTLEFAVQDRHSEVVWYSNPPDRNRMETIARGKTKDELGAQLYLRYYTFDNQERVLDSYNDSIKYGQYQVSMLPNGIRIDYVIGKKWEDNAILPVLLGKQSFDLMLSLIEKPADLKTIASNYRPVALISLGDRDITEGTVRREKVHGFTVISIADADMPLLAEVDELEAQLSGGLVTDLDRRILEDRLWSLKVRLVEASTVKANEVWDLLGTIANRRQETPAVKDMKAEHIAQYKNKPLYWLKKLPTFLQTSLINILKKSGYSMDEVSAAYVDIKLDAPTPNLEVFEVPLEFSLDGQNLVVRVPTSEIKYPLIEGEQWMSIANRQVLVRDTFIPLNRISVLPYFGAAHRDTGDGYIFVPDGSGALIYLNNGKTGVGAYSVAMYGIDYAVMAPPTKSMAPVARLPVFGLKQGDSAFIAIIEEGESMASIAADISGKVNSYNTVGARFTTMPFGTTFLEGQDQIPGSARGRVFTVNVYQSRLPESDIVIRYAFLDGQESDYVGMAKAYREYLVDRTGLEQLPVSEHLPFFVDLVGAISKRKTVLGIIREVSVPLTTMDNVSEIASRLVQSGVSDLRLRYRGWLSGGVRHTYPDKVVVETSLGNERRLRDLAASLTDAGVSFYPEVSFLHVYTDGRLGSFNVKRDAARFANRKPAQAYDYDLASGGLDASSGRYLLSPSRLGSLADSFLSSYLVYGIDGLSLTYAGEQVNGDYREDPKELIDRPQAQEVLAGLLSSMRHEKGLDLIVNGGNAYSLPYVSAVLNAPLTSSHHLLEDESIPFFAIALHGLVNYAGGPANLSEDYRDVVLRTVETGAAPYFMWIYSGNSAVRETSFDWLLSVHYMDWFASAVDFYAKADALLGDVTHQFIVGHERLADGVYQTVYEGGKSVIVNYRDTEVSVGDVTIAAKDYKVLMEGDEYDR
jgi:hypothetical protein